MVNAYIAAGDWDGRCAGDGLMCGFAGVWSSRPCSAEALAQQADGMAERLRHRGPDDRGVWVDPDAALALAHRRLSIVDLSPMGHQPMASACGRWLMAFNGEIYNHLALRQRLTQENAALPWRGGSDTETLLAAISAWGLAATLDACTGMFAFALWDRQCRTLTLARDRLGEKPLYYGWQQGQLLYASELKAFGAVAGFSPELNRGAIAALLGQGYIPGPATIYQGIHKLPSGTSLTLASPSHRADPKPYWSLARLIDRALAHPLEASDDAVLDAIAQALTASIGQQMLADVPVGAFLSGGIDSSLVTALMQAGSSTPVRTFSIGFEEAEYDEAPYARAVAQHLGTDHTALVVTAADALAVVPDLAQLYDEPFADPSQIPSVLLCAMTRRHVSVALSGDGGDELFAGYGRYSRAERLERLFSRVPPWLGQLLSHALLPLGVRASTLAALLAARSQRQRYQVVLRHWKFPQHVVIGGEAPVMQGQLASLDGVALAGMVAEGMACDQLDYLCDDILVKVDRAAMAASLETRVPMLDPRLIELAWRLPPSQRRRDGLGKWPLRQLLLRHLPADLVDRPKMGFGVPLDSWLRGPLREWAEAMLDPGLLRRQGLLRPGPIRRLWEAHLAGRANGNHYLWDVLMLQAWLQHQP